jgi:hypothetical protein
MKRIYNLLQIVLVFFQNKKEVLLVSLLQLVIFILLEKI